jgi:hypothetical protein
VPADVSTLTPRVHDRLRIRSLWWLPPALVVVIVTVAVIPRVLANPATVSRVTVANPTPYPMEIDVTGAHRDGWMGLGTAERESTTVMQSVVDQGDTWTFHFRSQGLDAGELQLSKNELQRSGWRVAIPAAVGERLARQGVPPPPPTGY